jgi:hypothetical protein
VCHLISSSKAEIIKQSNIGSLLLSTFFSTPLEKCGMFLFCTMTDQFVEATEQHREEEPFGKSME